MPRRVGSTSSSCITSRSVAYSSTYPKGWMHLLIVLSGLPGTGKSTIARTIAGASGATYVRIDTIEQALRSSGAVSGEMGPHGYVVAYAVAEDNLRLGRDVIADSVNPIAVTREAWRQVASRAGAA